MIGPRPSTCSLAACTVSRRTEQSSDRWRAMSLIVGTGEASKQHNAAIKWRNCSRALLQMFRYLGSETAKIRRYGIDGSTDIPANTKARQNFSTDAHMRVCKSMMRILAARRTTDTQPSTAQQPCARPRSGTSSREHALTAHVLGPIFSKLARSASIFGSSSSPNQSRSPR